MVELKFTEPTALQTAKMQVRNAREMLPRAKSCPWLDVQKTHEERRPSRAIRSAFELLKDLGQREGIQPGDVSLQLKYRSLCVKEVKMCWLDRDGDLQ